MYGWHNFGGGFMWLVWILIIVALVWFVMIATRKRGDDSQRNPSALEILRQRYARGEIDRQEFEQKKQDLDG